MVRPPVNEVTEPSKEDDRFRAQHPRCSDTVRPEILDIQNEPAAMDKLVGHYGLRGAAIEKGRLNNDADVPCLDWSNSQA